LTVKQQRNVTFTCAMHELARVSRRTMRIHIVSSHNYVNSKIDVKGTNQACSTNL